MLRDMPVTGRSIRRSHSRNTPAVMTSAAVSDSSVIRLRRRISWV